MKVRELQEQLDNFEDDAEIKIVDEENGVVFNPSTVQESMDSKNAHIYFFEEAINV